MRRVRAQLNEASVEDVVDKIVKRVHNENLVDRLTQKVVLYDHTHNPANDLTPQETGMIYPDDQYGEELPLSRKKDVDISWSSHAEYRSDLRDVPPDKVNQDIADHMKKHLAIPEHKKETLKKPEGTMVVDYDTKRNPAEAQVITVWASRRTAKDVLDDADELADRGHKEQKRKYTNLPYIVHPRAVMKRLMSWGVKDNAILAASLAHDLLEDTSISEGEIRSLLGDDVLNLVKQVTKAKEDTRKSEWLKDVAKTADARAILLKAADRMENTFDFMHEGKADYAIDYLERASMIFKRLKGEAGALGGSVVSKAMTDYARMQKQLIEANKRSASSRQARRPDKSTFEQYRTIIHKFTQTLEKKIDNLIQDISKEGSDVEGDVSDLESAIVSLRTSLNSLGDVAREAIV